MKTMMKIIIAAVAIMALLASGAFAQNVISRGDAVARVASRTSFGSVLARDAVGSGQSVSRSSAIASASTSRIFDVDGVDIEEDDDGNLILIGNECFVDDGEDDFFPGTVERSSEMRGGSTGRFCCCALNWSIVKADGEVCSRNFVCFFS